MVHDHNKNKPAYPWVGEAFESLADLELADRARDMVNNQRTMDDVRQSDRAYRDFSQRVMEADAKYVMDGSGMKSGEPNQTPADEEMDISIRSPINHNYYPPQPRPGLSPLATALLVAAAILAGGAATYFLTRPDTAPPIDPSTYGLGLLPPDEPKAP